MCAAAFAAGAASAQQQPIVMKLSTATLNDTQHEFMKRYVAAVEKDSGGRIKGEIYPASQLGPIPSQIQGTQFGSIQGWIGPPEFLVGVDARFEVLSAPALFESDAHAMKFVQDEAFTKEFFQAGAAKGLIGVGLFFSGPMAIDSRTPIRKLADLQGKKFRVLASPFQTEPLKILGATAVPMSLGDVLPALQQGTIDGALSSVPVVTALRYYDAAKYNTVTAHQYVFSLATISKKWHDGLPADLQKIVVDDGLKSAKEVIPWANDFIKAQEKVWTEKGGELIKLSDAEQAEMMKKLANVGADIVKSKPEIKPMYDAMVAAAKRDK